MNKVDNSIHAAHYSSALRKPSTIKYIVVHYTANCGLTATAKNNANYFHRRDVYSNAHYIVDEGNIIYQSVPDLNNASHCADKQKYTNGGASMNGIVKNYNSIGIEMVSHSVNGKYYVPDQTMKNTIELIKSLQKKYNIPDTNVYRHYDVTGKLCPAPLVNTTAWKTFKNRLKEDDEVVRKLTIIENGSLKIVDSINVAGHEFIQISDLDDGKIVVKYDPVKRMITING